MDALRQKGGSDEAKAKMAAEAASGSRQPLFIGADIYRKQAFGPHHPLGIPRVTLVYELCAMLGWFEGEAFRRSPRANRAALRSFHQPDYIEALARASEEQRVSAETRKRYHLGTMANPIFPGLFERASTAVGGSILAGELAAEGRVVFHPSGGTHHGRPGRASGFCYFNDPVFAVLTLLEKGLARVLYVDLDAHHGDGVQDAFAAEPRVLTVSIHEEGRWPRTGERDDRGGGSARNLPVPRGFNDTELAYLMDEAVLPLSQRFAPEAVVVTCGTDGLDGDPLTAMALSNRALWQAVQQLTALTDVTVVLGGGGYNPWTLARCWTGLWGLLSGQKLPERLPEAGQALLAEVSCDLIDDEDVLPEWTTTLVDAPRPGALRAEVRDLPAGVLAE